MGFRSVSCIIRSVGVVTGVFLIFSWRLSGDVELGSP